MSTESGNGIPCGRGTFYGQAVRKRAGDADPPDAACPEGMLIVNKEAETDFQKRLSIMSRRV